MVFFFNDTATTEIYTLSLHDALPICSVTAGACRRWRAWRRGSRTTWAATCSRPRRSSAARCSIARSRSEEHTSELQSRLHLVCRLLLGKKNEDLERQRLA